MIIVLDSSAMIDYLKAEPGGAKVRQLLEGATVTAYAHAMNMIEVFYEYSRSGDVLTARAALETLRSDGVETRDDLDAAFYEDAAQLKAGWKRISLADCCGVALSRRLDAEFFTTDRHELEKLAAANVARITFLR